METSVSQLSEADRQSANPRELPDEAPSATSDKMKEVHEQAPSATFNIDNLHSQKLRIPNLWPAFEGWKRGINPLYDPLRYDPETLMPFGDVDTYDGKSRLRRSIDRRLWELFQHDPVKLEKAKAVDIGLFASCLFPDAPYEILETAAFYCIWLFFWDDAIDSNDDNITTGDGDSIAGTADAGREYCRKSVAFIRCCLALPERHYPVDCPAPTDVCASFEAVAGRVRETWKKGLTTDLDLISGQKLRSFQRSLERYMNACVVEQAWRLSSLGRSQVPPSEENFWGWRLGTSSVDAFLDLSIILNNVTVPWVILEYVGQKLGLLVNKLLVCINELFSFKKELKDKTGHMNLIPITMHASKDPMNLEAAVQKIVGDIHSYAAEFNHVSSLGSRQIPASPGFRGVPLQQARERFDQMVSACQAVVTAVLHFSIESPRYGISKDRLPGEEGGGFLVTF